MDTLTSVFQALLSMALTALPVVAVVLLARLFLRKAPKKPEEHSRTGNRLRQKHFDSCCRFLFRPEC